MRRPRQSRTRATTVPTSSLLHLCHFYIYLAFQPFLHLQRCLRDLKTEGLALHPLLPRFQSHDTPEVILAVLREQFPERAPF